MNRFNFLALGLALGLAACNGGGDSDTSGGKDTNGGGSFDAQPTWSGTGVTLAITKGTDTTGYDFGMTQTGSDNGWAGEDCLSAIPAGYEYMQDGDANQYQICHRVTQTGGSLSTVTDRDAVVDGSTTLFSQGLSSTITYVLFEASSSACWSWGDDVLYYDAYSCTIL